MRTCYTINDDHEIWVEPPPVKKLTKALCDMVDLAHPVADISPPNLRNVKIFLHNDDVYTKTDFIHGFNYDKAFSLEKKYMTIFCFEVIEHVKNPLQFLESIVTGMDEDSLLYLSTPYRPWPAWGKKHFVEYPKSRLLWLFEEVGLEVVQYKRLWFGEIKLKAFYGLRPFLTIFGINHIFELRKKHA